ncbi:MAG: acyl dehydratase [Gammaproteobacteria bacterium]
MNEEIQRRVGDVSVGEEIGNVSIPITLQRLVIEAGANRDFSLIHHDQKVAQATGAPDAYMNTFFIAGMFERLLRKWMGAHGRLNKMGNLRMKIFNSVGDTATFTGRVESINTSSNQVDIALTSATDNGITVTADATVTLPDT